MTPKRLTLDRRQLLGAAAATLATGAAPAPVEPSWEGLAARWHVPAWFRDAKFGIWAHWSAQCVPEFGDWYARKMYVQGDPFYAHHLETYGHPADTGFLDVIGRWRAERWDPAALIRRFKAAGAKYVVALATHHDNVDCYASSHHGWNSVRVGPRRDIVGTWARAARAAGLRFGVSNHASHAWHWLQPAYGYDPEGSRAGERYDAHRLRARDGAGTWWQGLDPQELYTGATMAPPAGIASIAAMNEWHRTHDRVWTEEAPAANPRFVANWLLRQNELVDLYRPDLVYLDNTGLPFGATGLAAAAHYYAQGGEPVLTAKQLSPLQRRGLLEDVERGWSDRLRPEPWQTCTCIGDWHYNRARFEQNSYVPAKQVIQRLCDVVAKNGNLLLSIPMRGDGTIDAAEEVILDGITGWMRVNGAAVHGSRPWRSYGEGQTPVGTGGEAKPFTPQDVRFTVTGKRLNAVLLDWPTAPVAIASLGRDRLGGAAVEQARLADGRPVAFRHKAAALHLTLPPPRPGEVVPVVRLSGRGLV